uniref:Cytochrome c oxidase subunit 7A2, mitochondrial n=1 Tax=Monodelphis domestica TaxID=13616 RepID=A0A5F8GG74_MONDO
MIRSLIFHEDDGIPVHLKSGVGDALLYRGTILFSVVGTFYALYHLGMVSFPKKHNRLMFISIGIN